MELAVTRGPNHDDSCIGDLFVDDAFQCYTLEDLVREVDGQPVASWKIQNQTAIPRGRYRVTIRFSPHFNRMMPHIEDVPGFTEVMLHWGNTSIDTDGCILVGQHRTDDAIQQARAAFDALFPMIQDAINDGDDVWITVK